MLSQLIKVQIRHLEISRIIISSSSSIAGSSPHNRVNVELFKAMMSETRIPRMMQIIMEYPYKILTRHQQRSSKTMVLPRLHHHKIRNSRLRRTRPL